MTKLAGSGAEQGRPRWYARTGPVALLCLGLALLAYAPALGNGFYNDDALFLNHARRVVADPPALFTERPLGYFRPTWSAYVTLQWLCFGLQPLGYHVVGVLLHALTGLLVWMLARRLLRARAGDLVPLGAAVAFVCFFAHCEGPIWFAAHNSTLAAMLCVLATLLHLRAVEGDQRDAAREAAGTRDAGRRARQAGRALLTALAVLAALLAKEPSAVVLAWLPAVEATVFGFRSLVRPASLLRGGLVAAAAAAFVLSNARVGDTFSHAGAEPPATEVRAQLGFVTLDGAVGTAARMFSPLRHEDFPPRWWQGALVLGGILLLTAWRRRDLLPAALCGTLLLLTALLPTSLTRIQQANGSRLYYFPTVGAAVLVGVVLAVCTGARGAATVTLGSAPRDAPGPAPRDTPGPAPRGARRSVAMLVAILFIAGCAWHVHSIHAINAEIYEPIARRQTRLAHDMDAALSAAGPHPVFLLQPWISNTMHLQEFLQLYCDVAPVRVKRLSVKLADYASWVERQHQLDAGAVLLDWNDERGLVPATGPPPARNDAPGAPESVLEASAGAPLNVMRIAPHDGH